MCFGRVSLGLSKDVGVEGGRWEGDYRYETVSEVEKEVGCGKKRLSQRNIYRFHEEGRLDILLMKD